MYRLTDENLNYIKKQYAKGISITAIAETFGIPRAAISLRLRQMGVTHKPRKIGITEQQLVYIKTRYCEDDVSVNTIAKELGFGRDVIARRLKQMNINTPPHGRSATHPIINGKRVCLDCGREKALSEFRKVPTRVGYKSYCNSCDNKRSLRNKRRRAPLEIMYDVFYQEQGGVCAICRKPEKQKVKGTILRLALDHDHRTGKLRGLLCSECNRAIGLLHDNPDYCMYAAHYLLEADK